MCRFVYNELKLGYRSKTCSIGEYLDNFPDSHPPPKFRDLPLDTNGMCIFHSGMLEWKQANHFFERFLDLFFCQNSDDRLEEIDFREFQIIGLPENELSDAEMNLIRPAQSLTSYRSSFFRQTLLQGFKIGKPWIFTESVFHDDTVFAGLTAKKKLDFDGVCFKGFLTMKDCVIDSFTLFKEQCEFRRTLYLENSRFSRYIDFEGARFSNSVNIKYCVFDEFIFSNVTIGEAQEGVDADIWNIIQENTFNKRVDFRRSTFQNNTAITSCDFKNEVRFDDTHFNKGFNLVKPKIEDNIYFVSSDKTIKLFDSSINFLFDEQAFSGTGQILFKNVNLFQLNPAFKEKLRTYEISHRVDIENCLRYRVSIERIYQTKQIDNRIITDLCNAFSAFYYHQTGKNLNVEVLRNSQENHVKVIYHTDDNLDIEQFEDLIFQCKNDFLKTVMTAGPSAEALDTRAAFMSIVDRYIAGVSREAAQPGTLVDFFSFSGDGKPVIAEGLPNIVIPQIINFHHHHAPRMNIQSLNIYGGSQQFATTIINNSKNLTEADAGILELINRNVPTEEGKAELIKSLEVINTPEQPEAEKDEARDLLKKFLQEGVGEAGKEIAKGLLNGGSWAWLLQFLS